MGILTIISAAIRGIGLLSNNPALGGGSSVRFTELNELMGILGDLIDAGSDAHDELKAFSAKIAEMVEQGRGPTRIEWENIRSRSIAAHETIQEAAARIRREEEAEVAAAEATRVAEAEAAEAAFEAERVAAEEAAAAEVAEAEEAAEAARVAVAEEIAALEATELERDLTDDELARLAELRGTSE